MITQCEVNILTDAIKEASGLDIPSDAALTALYALADYNYRLIPQKPEPHKYVIGEPEGAAAPEHEPKPDATAHIASRRRGRPVKIVRLVRARTQAAVATRAPVQGALRDLNDE